MYVAVMMAAAEAMSPVGSVLGAIVTFVLYGLLPITIVGYIMSSPARKRARLAREQASARIAPNASGESTGDVIASERKQP
jgi:hypothetical protein